MAEAFAEVERRAIPKVPDPAGQGGGHPVLRGVHPHPALASRRRPSGCRPTCSRFAVASSSVKKGESLRDTVETIEAMGIDAVIIRHASSGAPAQVARWVERARGGQRRRRLARAPDPGAARLLHRAPGAGRAQGRGARGARHRLLRGAARARSSATSATAGWPAPRCWPTPPSGPRSPWPRRAPCCRRRSRAGRSTVAPDLDAALARPTWSRSCGSRPSGGAASFVPTLREYTAGYGLTARRAAPAAADDAIVTHPGPMVRGVEIASDVADLPRTVVTQQVANGVAVRMAVLFLLLGRGAARARRRCRPLPEHRRWSSGAARWSDADRPAPRRRRRGRRHAWSSWPRPSTPPAGRRRCSTPAAAWSAPGLVDLHTHLRQPGREEAETIETGARAAALGGLHRGRGHAQHRAAHRLGRSGGRACSRSGAGCLAEVAVAGAITVGPGRASALAPMAELAALGVHALHRRRRRGAGRRPHAPGPRVRHGPRGDAGPALRGRAAWPPAAPCTRGAGRAASACPGMPAAAEEVMVARDIALCPADRRAGPLPAPLDRRLGGPGRAGPRPRAWRSRPRRRRTTCILTDAARGRVRPGLQGQPAAAHRRRTWPPSGRPVRRHHRRHRHRPRPARARGQGPAVRPGPPGHARAADGAGPRLARSWRRTSRPSGSSRC